MHAYAEAARHLERALELLERTPADEMPAGVGRPGLSARAAEAAALSGAPRRAIAIARQLVAETDAAADPTAAGLAHARLARFLWLDGDGDAAIAHYETALELVPREPSTERAEVLGSSARVLMLMGRLTDARARCAEALEIARATGARLVEANLLNTLGAARGAGDLEQDRRTLWAAREIAEELAAVEEVGRSYVNECSMMAASAHTVLGRIAAERGAFDDGREHVARSEALSRRSGGAMWAGPNLAILAACAMWSGDLDEMHSIVGTALEQFGDASLWVAPLWTIGIRAEVGRAARARASGRDAEVEECESAARRLLELFDSAEADEQVSREAAAAAAELSTLAGDHDPAPWLDLARSWREASQPYRAAYADWRAAQAMVHSGGSPDEARRLLASAAEEATRRGARPLLDEITGLARRARLDLGDGAPARTSSTADEIGLTDREREVLLLLAEGRTNRQIGETLFMSEKTASVHVSRILSKLGASNRAEAAGMAHALGLEPLPGSGL